MIELKVALIAEYAVAFEGKLTIAGTFDTFDVARSQGVLPEDIKVIVAPKMYLALITEASLSDGLQHTLRVRVLTGNGTPLAEMEMPIQFQMNDLGRRMKHNTVAMIPALPLPGCDDYTFEISVAGDPATRLGEVILSVVDRTPTDG